MTKYLLDTHTLIWLIESSPKVTKQIKEKLKFPETRVFLSTVSLWEIAIKTSIGRLDLKLPLDKLFSDLHKTDVTMLQIENSHLLNLAELPFIHKDPFDRMLVATAIAEGLTIITADKNIQKYEVAWVW